MAFAWIPTTLKYFSNFFQHMMNFYHWNYEILPRFFNLNLEENITYLYIKCFCVCYVSVCAMLSYHQMVNTEITLIISFAAKDWDALYSQQKQDWELTVAQFMESLLPNSDLNWRKQGKPLDHSSMNGLNQIPYDYTVEVRNRFKGLDLIDSAWWTMDGGLWHCTEDRDQDHPYRK